MSIYKTKVIVQTGFPVLQVWINLMTICRRQNCHFATLLVFILLNSDLYGQDRYLITNVNVVDVSTGQIHKNQFVLIEGSIIKSISRKKPSEKTTTEFNGKDKFLMPGLINMYTHVNEDNLILYLTNGQTTVKDAPSHLTALGLREKISGGELLGPRIFAVGLRATGMPAPYQSQQPIRTAVEGIEQVREAKRLGYDGMFIYGSCDPETYGSILLEAERVGLHITGHYPQYVDLDEALNTTQKSFDNLSGLTSRGELRVNRTDLIQGLAVTGQAITPTLTIHRLWSLSNRNDSIYAAIPKEYIPNKMKANWMPIENGSGTYPYHKVEDLILEMYKSGVNLYIGSDGGYPLVVNGFSYHQEIENFSKLGIPNEEVLKIATIKSALFLGYKNLGLVEKDYLADLLLLDANPISDLKNLRKISYVFANGKPISRHQLDNKLMELKKSIETPPDRFKNWKETIAKWKNDSTLHFDLKNNNVTVGEEVIRLSSNDNRNFDLESINVMDGPDGRQTYLFARVRNKRMDSLEIKTISPEGIYRASISTTKTKAIIQGSAPFHGDFYYEEDLPYGTLLLGPFTSRYYELDIVANYVLALTLKRNGLQINQADQLPVIQIELNSEEFGKHLIVDKSEYVILREGETSYKVIYNTFSGYRTITAPSFVIDIKLDPNVGFFEIGLENRKMTLSR